MKNQLLTVLLSLGLTTSLSAQQVSVNCPEGNNWQTEKRAVVSPQWAYDGSNNQKWFVRNDDGSNNLMAGTMNSVGQKADATPTIAIYPVPVTDVLNIKVNGSTPVKSVTLISPLGTKTIQTVFASQSNHNITLDVHHMAAGIYYVNVLFDNGNETTAKFVKIDK